MFVERLWWSVKHEEVYLKDYRSVAEAIESLSRYFHRFNHLRPHQALGNKTPAAVSFEGKKDAASRRIS